MSIAKKQILILTTGLLVCLFLSCSEDVSDDLLDDKVVQEESIDPQKEYEGDESTDTGNESDDDDDDDEDDDDDDDDDDNDDELVKHPTLYFVQLDANITEDEIEDLLEDLNSEEIWFREEINLRLWNTTSFTSTNASGNPITNIDGQIARARTRARVSNATFNLGSNVGNPANPQQLFCFDESIDLAPTGSNPVRISIFDTGIQADIISNLTGYDYIDDDNNPEDDNGHGTQIAGLIQSLVNNNGAAPNISFDIRKTHDAQGMGFLSTLIPAILDAVNDGTDILNFSFSYQDVNRDTENKPMRLAITYAEQNGVLISAAAGNINKNNDHDDLISFPASYPNTNIIATTALSCEKKLSRFSSYGRNSVDLAFLGENIPVKGLGGTNVEQSGTSFSTACITAMSAIMASRQSKMDAAEIKCVLINNSEYSDDLKDLVASQGVVDFQAALMALGNCK